MKKKCRKTWKLKAKSTGVWFYLPSNLDLSRIPQLSALEPEAQWFVHKILVTQMIFGLDANEYVNISRETMRQHIQPVMVSVVRSELIKAGVIECDDDFHIDAYSKGYRLAKKYSSTFQRVEVTKKSLAKKIVAQRRLIHNKAVPEDSFDAPERYLLDWLRKVQIDKDAAYAVIEKYAQTKQQKEQRTKHKTTLTKQTPQIERSKAIQKMAVDLLQYGEFDFSVCRYGRVHNPVTRMLTEVRSLLSFAGCEPLVTIDVSNSQVVFLCLLIIDSFTNWTIKSASNHSSNPSFSSDVFTSDTSNVLFGIKNPSSSTSYSSSLFSSSNILPSSLLPSPTPNTTRGIFSTVEAAVNGKGQATTGGKADQTYQSHRMPADVTDFLNEVMRGTIYQRLMRDFNEGLPPEKHVIDRKGFKQTFFRDILFGDTSKGWVANSRLATIFAKAFPRVWRFIQYKKRWNGAGDAKDAFKSLACEMQRAESGFMIHKVVPRLMTDHPHIPILTIHDSVLCPANHANTVERIIMEEFGKIGIRPTLHIDGPKAQTTQPLIEVNTNG